MALKITHAFVSGKPAVLGSDKVQGTHWDAEHKIVDTATGLPFTGGTLIPVGTIIDFAGHTVPVGWLECAGQALVNAAYPALYAALVKNATVTVAPGSPTVISWVAHGRHAGDTIYLFSLAPPAGIVSGQKYYVSSQGLAADSFRISETYEGPTVIATTSAGAVVQGTFAPYGVINVSFYLPDLREVVTAGPSNMGTGFSARFSGNYAPGEVFGDEFAYLTTAQMPSHSHGGGTSAQSANHTHAVSGSGSGSGTTDLISLWHDHAIPIEYFNQISGGGNRMGFQPFEQAGSTGNAYVFSQAVDLSHQHGFSVSISVSGSTGTELEAHGHTIAAEGGSAGHPNVQPTLFIRKIIYAGV